MNRVGLKGKALDRSDRFTAAPHFVSGQPAAPFGNFAGDDPLSIDEICASLHKLTDGWPKCVSGTLAYREKDALVPLLKPAELFAWMGSHSRINWRGGSRAVTKEELFYRLQQRERWDWGTLYQHFPKLSGVLYLDEPPTAKNNGVINQLLDFFEPRSDNDRELIRALVLTPFWSGRPGTRPQFVIAADEVGDEDSGRGVGKTTLAQVIGGLVGGCIDIDPTGSHDRISSNLLSPDAWNRRVILMDNLKTSRFSNEFLEKLITRTEITGHRLYRGFATRPNLLTWIVTVNGPSFSTDMAQRSIPIHLKRPKSPRPGWMSELRQFLEAKRTSLLADIRWHLEVKKGRSPGPSRWSEWAAEVLAKCRYPDDLLDYVQRQRLSLDADKEEMLQAVEHIRNCIDEYFKKGHGFADTARVWAPTAWLVKVLGEWRKDLTDRQSQMFLRRLEGTKRLRKNRRNDQQGYVWTGEKPDPADCPNISAIRYRPSLPR